MNNNVHFGYGVIDEAKSDVNNRAKGLIKIAIDVVFDYLEGKVEDLPKVL